MNNNNNRRTTMMPEPDNNGIRHWGGTPDTAIASDDLAAMRRDLDTVFNALTNFIDDLPDKIKQLVDLRMKASQNETRAMIAEALGELRGELRGVLTGIRDSTDPNARRKSEFKFAGEVDNSDGAIDLPNWRHGRTILN